MQFSQLGKQDAKALRNMLSSLFQQLFLRLYFVFLCLDKFYVNFIALF